MRLSPRQTQVVALVVRGLSNKGIAAEAGLSHKTVEVYLDRISKRLPGEGKPRMKILRYYFATQQP